MEEWQDEADHLRQGGGLLDGWHDEVEEPAVPRYMEPTTSSVNMLEARVGAAPAETGRSQGSARSARQDTQRQRSARLAGDATTRNGGVQLWNASLTSNSDSHDLWLDVAAGMPPRAQEQLTTADGGFILPSANRIWSNIVAKHGDSVPKSAAPPSAANGARPPSANGGRPPSANNGGRPPSASRFTAERQRQGLMTKATERSEEIQRILQLERQHANWPGVGATSRRLTRGERKEIQTRLYRAPNRSQRGGAHSSSTLREVTI